MSRTNCLKRLESSVTWSGSRRFALAVATACVFVAASEGQHWIRSYDAASEMLPDDPNQPESSRWSAYGCWDPNNARVEGGILYQGPTGDPNIQGWEGASRLLDFEGSNAFILEAELRIDGTSTYLEHFNNGGVDCWRAGYALSASDKDGHWFLVGIASDPNAEKHGARVTTRHDWPNDPNFSTSLFDCETWHGFHKYRVVVSNGQATLYIDDVEKPEQLEIYQNDQGTGLNRVAFGDPTGYGSSQTQLHYIRFGLQWGLGDLNCDGLVDFDDIDPFMLALTSKAQYEAAYPDCDYFNADCNLDGNVDYDDIGPFIALLSG